MKKNRVSFISLLLAVMMLLSSVSVPFASEKAAAGDRTELTPDFGMPSTFPNVGEQRQPESLISFWLRRRTAYCWISSQE